ncbi:MAG TPA: hypothetical protein VL020_04000, partial [Pseudomonadales bacterium]|nr:hypothetical protein [Pseudomonadales bacterium]
YRRSAMEVDGVMIKLSEIEKVTRRGTVFVLPGGVEVSNEFKALNVLWNLKTLHDKAKEARELRRMQRVTEGGATITRKQSGNSRYFLGV